MTDRASAMDRYTAPDELDERARRALAADHPRVEDVLPVGTRVRSRRHPELTGYIKGHEWTRPGLLSPIPYCIGWDDSPLAAEVIGWLFVYASDAGVEAIQP